MSAGKSRFTLTGTYPGAQAAIAAARQLQLDKAAEATARDLLASRDRVEAAPGVSKSRTTDDVLHTVAAAAKLVGAGRSSSKASEFKPDLPPATAEWLLAVLTPKTTRLAMLGDFLEEYHANVARSGVRRARQLAWVEVIRSAAPLLWSALLRVGALSAAVRFLRGS